MYDFIQPLDFVMSGSENFMVRPTWKRWKIHVHKMRMRPLELLGSDLAGSEDLIQTGEICDAKTIIMPIQYWDLINK